MHHQVLGTCQLYVRGSILAAEPDYYFLVLGDIRPVRYQPRTTLSVAWGPHLSTRHVFEQQPMARISCNPCKPWWPLRRLSQGLPQLTKPPRKKRVDKAYGKETNGRVTETVTVNKSIMFRGVIRFILAP